MTGPMKPIQPMKPRNPDLYIRIRRPRVYYRFSRRIVGAILRRLWRGVIALWHYESTGMAELSSGWWLLLWGFIMLVPGDAFDASHGYDKMRVLPEWLWAMASMMVGSCQLVATLYGGVCKRRILARIAFSFYLLLTGLFLFGKWPVCVGLYGSFALLALWVHWRLAGRKCEEV